MSTNKSKVAVIGLGNIGKAVASNLVKGNREIIVASHKPYRGLWLLDGGKANRNHVVQYYSYPDYK